MRYRVCNWERFQHYRDRNPPWIKLHFSMLSSTDWVTLDDRSRVLAIVCMLLASRNDGFVPGDPEYIRRVAYLSKPPDFKPLIQCGFLEVASACKQVLASARPEAQAKDTQETETEKNKKEEETETEVLASASKVLARASTATRFPEDFQLNEVMRAYATLRLPKVDVEEVFQQFRDHHLTKGKTSKDWLASWRTWVGNCNRFGYPMTTATADRTPQLRFDANGRQIDAG